MASWQLLLATSGQPFRFGSQFNLSAGLVWPVASGQSTTGHISGNCADLSFAHRHQHVSFLGKQLRYGGNYRHYLLRGGRGGGGGGGECWKKNSLSLIELI